MRQLLENFEHLQDKISRIKQEVKNQERQHVAKMEISHLYPKAHILRVVCAIEESMEQVALHILASKESLIQPRGRAVAPPSRVVSRPSALDNYWGQFMMNLISRKVKH